MYISQTELENYLKRSLTDSEASSLSLLGEAAKEAIDNYTDTNWDTNVSETTRYYDGGDCELDIDTCHTVSEVASVNKDETVVNTFDSDYYILEPRNSNIKWSVRRRYGNFPYGLSNIRVKAKFTSNYTGDDDGIPDSVKLASLKLVDYALNNPHNLKSESIEGYSYTMSEALTTDQEIKGLLTKYRRIYA